MTRLRDAAIAAVILMSGSIAASAQDGVSIYGYGTFGTLRLDAARTFEAVSGSSRTTVAGAGIQVTGIWRDLFADAAWSRSSVEGERVFIDNDRTFPLGIPLRVTMQPLDIAAGWRLRYGRWSPYVGVGFSRLAYEESSDAAVEGEDLATSSVGPLFIGGVDLIALRLLRIGGELRFRHIGGILGTGGTSAELRETSAGGWALGVRISVGR